MSSTHNCKTVLAISHDLLKIYIILYNCDVTSMKENEDFSFKKDFLYKYEMRLNV